ncbi:MAG: metallophosphoesterase [Methanotrichaceae archaeon]|nr:metallophosphoesterase [Methanotrichaceae archaeon]
MKILAIADLHGRVDRILSLEPGDADLIVVCGDLHNGGSEEEARPVVEALSGIGIPVLIVPGNMDPRIFSAQLWKEAGFVSLHCRSYRFRDFGFIGMGGIVARGGRDPDNPARQYHRDEDVYENLSRAYEEITNVRRKIVVTHQPPFGFLDTLYNGEPSGSLSLRKFLEERQPDLLLCGHIHEARGIAHLGRTLGVNVGELRCGYSALVELNDEIRVHWSVLGPVD